MALADIGVGGARSFAHLDQRIALFRTSRGVFACDNHHALTDGSPQDALTALVTALNGGAPVTAIIDATSQAAAERLARFDIDLDTDDTNEWGWLDVTHTLTYSTRSAGPGLPP